MIDQQGGVTLSQDGAEVSRLPAVTNRRPRILIVDDELPDRQLLLVMLGPEDFHLQTASSGAEALTIVAAEPPDLILLDVMMPDMDGYQVAESVRRDLRSRNIPIIMITALGDRDARLHGLRAGAIDFHTKPIDRTALVVQMKNLLRLKEYGDMADRQSRQLAIDAGAQTAALREEHELAQRCLDTADVILLALDMTGRITLVNRCACTLLGWTEAELLGRDWIETCIPVRLRDQLREVLTAVTRGELVRAENLVVTRGGAERMIEWRNTLTRDSEGRCIGTFSSGTDVTEWNQALVALRAAEERMRFALQNANVGIWDADHVTGMVHWSDVMERHFGVEPGTFGGTFDAFIERVHPEDRAAVFAAVESARKSGALFSIEHRVLLPDGGVRWLVAAGRVQASANGSSMRAVGISQDITERRELERLYGQSQKMEAMGQLVSGVAHDFNNLLTVILGCAELVAEEASPASRNGEDLGELIKAAERAKGLTRQLLAFGRKQSFQPGALDLNQLVNGMSGLLGRLVGREVAIVLELEPELPLVTADNGQMEQVTMNLVINASDAMAGGGTLTIRTASVDNPDWPEQPVPPGRYVMLAVTDTGSGMAAATIEKAFEPFFTTKSDGRGTGLGLSTVHSIVQQSQGQVRIASELGQGTTFTVYLPCRLPDPDSGQPASG